MSNSRTTSRTVYVAQWGYKGGTVQDPDWYWNSYHKERATLAEAAVDEERLRADVYLGVKSGKYRIVERTTIITVTKVTGDDSPEPEVQAA